MPLRDVRPTREMTSRADEERRQAPRDLGGGRTAFGPGLSTGGQVNALGNGQFAVTGGPGSVGETSPNFRDDPTVNAIVDLPSQREAEQYTGAHPSFYGIQRPGDWLRVVQRQMAGDRLPGGPEQLNRLVDARVQNERFRGRM